MSEPHDHDFYEFFWVTSGAGAHLVNGRVEPLATGDLLWIRARDCHGFGSDSGDLQMLNIAFSAEHFDGLAARYQQVGTRYWPTADAQALPTQRRLSEGRLATLDRAAAALLDRRHDLLALDAFLLRLLDSLESESAGGEPAEALPDWLAEALEQIREPAHFRQGAAEFARLCGRSHEHVSRVLRELTGQSPSELITELRMAHAARQLAITDQPILSIAYDCGYQSLGQFYAAFKRRYHSTPARHRRRQAEVF